MDHLRSFIGVLLCVTVAAGLTCFPWLQTEFVTGTVSNYVADSCCGIGDCSTSNRAFYLQSLQGAYGGTGSLLGWDPSSTNAFVYDAVHQVITMTGKIKGCVRSFYSSIYD
jgi:hypothetical protein